MEKDPVRGMDVDPRSALSASHGGRTTYFCSPGCKKQFEDNPGQYVED